MLEHGAYTLLMDRYYATEAGIPDSEKYRVCRAGSKPEKAAVDAVLREFFKLVDGIWIKNRCEEEIQQARERSQEGRDRAENEKERQRRHRAERKKLFKQLREYDIVPPFDTKAEALRELLLNAQVTDLSRVTGVTEQSDKTCTATAIHTPGTTYQYPDTNTQDSEARMDEDPGRVTGGLIEGPCHELQHLGSPQAESEADQACLEQSRHESPLRGPSTLTGADHSAGFERVQAAYPKFAGAVFWLVVENHCRTLVTSGEATWQELAEGAKRYADFCEATDRTGTNFVTNPEKFFGDGKERWKQAWDPPKSKAERRQDTNVDESLRWLELEEARDAQR